MNLQQKSKKIKEIKRGMRKAALIGLASLVTTTALGKESKNDFGGDVKNNQTEIPTVSPAEKSPECACYINNLTLDAQSPISQIYKVSSHKAFYSHYLNGGVGGIVFTRFHISDADAFGNANQTSPEKFSGALSNFASRARNFGYKAEIKNLDEALQHILHDLTPSEQKIVLNALNVYCRDDADKLTDALLRDSDSLMKMRAETSKENIAADLQYIREKRSAFLQKNEEEKYAGMNLVRIDSLQDNSLHLTPAMFRQPSAERK